MGEVESRYTIRLTVTKRSCLWCGRTFTVSGGPGRPRLYCKPSCKQRDYEARRRSEELGLGEHELVVTREELESIRDRQFLLACTVEDVQRDLANGDVDERDAFGVLLEAAREFVASRSRPARRWGQTPIAKDVACRTTGVGHRRSGPA